MVILSVVERALNTEAQLFWHNVRRRMADAINVVSGWQNGLHLGNSPIPRLVASGAAVYLVFPPVGGVALGHPTNSTHSIGPSKTHPRPLSGPKTARQRTRRVGCAWATHQSHIPHCVLLQQRRSSEEQCGCTTGKKMRLSMHVIARRVHDGSRMALRFIRATTPAGGSARNHGSFKPNVPEKT